ncbi:MAG: YicC/YloC family endoribonuclease [Haliscomenobacter sp.]
MLLSMTGFGRVAGTFQNKTISIEIRSLNSKFTDMRIKAPMGYREKEHEIRRMLSDRLERGKIEFTLDIQNPQGELGSLINTELFKRYYYELESLSRELSIPTGDIIQSILRMPEVVSGAQQEIDAAEWEAVKQTMHAALVEFDRFRATEGQVIEGDMRLRIGIIQDKLQEIAPFESERIEKLRQRIYQNLEDYLGKDKIDESRFEQEILFYLEKMDISEEKLRLGQHCQYFLEELDIVNTQKGRKLSFIAQEIGREINTLGAKSYSSDIQKMVVIMKDELEKIKEQIANCL